ncbi:hypothetical protein HMPREF3191_00744 [Veillonellaceae bacterium DNF00626]|nr:hypothetical protein HMPREF3191_00744 [Veillonellaceae bacterium DNF00626]
MSLPLSFLFLLCFLRFHSIQAITFLFHHNFITIDIKNKYYFIDNKTENNNSPYLKHKKSTPIV